jgi:predicted metal-binding membrane protein
MRAPRVVSPAARERRGVRTPLLLVTAVAWIVTVAVGHSWMASGSMGMGSMSSITMPNQMSMSVQPTISSLPSFLGMWALMLVAMMTPLLVNPLRHLYERSLQHRRARAMALFVTAYVGVWTFGELALLGMTYVLDRFGPVAMIGVGAAIFWQLTPAKKRCLNRHHARPPLAAFGRPADVDALRYGANSAFWCVGSCWGLMLLPLVIMSGQLAVMVVVTIWIWAEAFSQPSRPTWGVRLPTTAARIASAAIWPPVLRQSAACLPTPDRITHPVSDRRLRTGPARGHLGGLRIPRVSAECSSQESNGIRYTTT